MYDGSAPKVLPSRWYLTRPAIGRAYTRPVPRLMLLDAHSLIYRAYFALIETPLSTSKGQLVNAAFGFWSIVLRGFQDARPDHVVCCFDVGRPKRAERYQAYKGTRRPTPDDLREQFPIVRETLAAFRIPSSTSRATRLTTSSARCRSRRRLRASSRSSCRVTWTCSSWSPITPG